MRVSVTVDIFVCVGGVDVTTTVVSTAVVTVLVATLVDTDNVVLVMVR